LHSILAVQFYRFQQVFAVPLQLQAHCVQHTLGVLVDTFLLDGGD
jgi:hypothetical protein